jgi:hypothetical protein
MSSDVDTVWIADKRDLWTSRRLFLSMSSFKAVVGESDFWIELAVGDGIIVVLLKN